MFSRYSEKVAKFGSFPFSSLAVISECGCVAPVAGKHHAEGATGVSDGKAAWVRVTKYGSDQSNG